MEAADPIGKSWVDQSPHAKFWRQLLNSRVDLLVGSRSWLRALRYKNDEVRWWLKRAGHIFEERGLNLYQLIAESFDESWDSEDEEKSVPSTVKKKPRQDAVSVDHPRQVGVRQGQEEERKLHVRPGDEGRQGLVQAGRQSPKGRSGGARGSPQKAPP